MTHYAIGLDVGGTKVAGGIVESKTGTVLFQETIATQAARGGEAVLAACVALAKRLQDQAVAQALPLVGVGMGVCELVDPAGNVTSAYNFDWRSLAVKDTLGTLGLPVVVESDVRVAALAEAHYGAGQAFTYFGYITVGTGISSCIMLNGKPLAGARGNALVLASMPLSTVCTTCGTTLQPVLEEFAAGPALLARYQQATGQTVPNGQVLFHAVANQDPIARDIVQSAGAALGNSVAFLCNIIDPEAILIGGGLGLAGGLYWEAFVAATRAHIYAEDTRALPILPAALGVEAGLIGAAACVL
ncbi:MAG: ROK family protein [Caldilineaceae bacterium]|nr:ROK family protein [Caldilineaceae bacterium]